MEQDVTCFGALKNVLVLILVISNGVKIQAQGQNCVIDGKTPNQSGNLNIDYEVMDTVKGGDTFKELDTENVIDFQGDGTKYVDVSFEENKLFIKAKKEFEEFEKTNTKMTEAVSFTVSCEKGGNSFVIISLDIKDTNNHNPHFLDEEDVTVKIATPMGSGFPVIPTYGIMETRDYDLTNYNITFSITDNEYFTIGWLKQTSDTYGKGVHAATIVTSKVIKNLPQPVKLTITITDQDRTGNDRRTAKKILTIESDPEFEILPTPKFEETFYKGKLDHNLVSVDQIKLIEGVEEPISVSANNDFFTAEHSGNGEIKISTKGNIPDEVLEEHDYFLFSIDATNKDEKGSTTVYLDIIKTPLEEMEFEEPTYNGIYYYQNKSSVLPTIKLSKGFASGTIFTISGDNNGYFDKEENGDTIDLSVKTELPESLLEKSQFVTLILKAERSGAISTSVPISIALIPKPVTLQFAESNYNGLYFIQNNSLVISHAVLSAGFTEEVKFDKKGDLEKLFRIESIGNTVKIDVIEDFIENLPKDATLVSFTLAAERSDAIPTFTIINIEIKEDLAPLEEMEFEEPTYNGIYYYQNKSSVLPTIKLSKGFASGIIFTISGDDSGYFEKEENGDTIDLSVKTELPESLLEKSQFVTLILKAERSGAISTSVPISITLNPKPVFLQFAESNYNGLYFIQNNSLVISEAVLSAGFTEEVKFDKKGDLEKLFRIESIGNTVKIDVVEDFIENLPKDATLVSFTLTAERSDAIPTFTTINIEIKKNLDIIDKALSFTSHHYSGSYSKDHVITIEADIMLKEDDIDIDQVTVEVIGDELVKEYFSVKWNGEKFEVQTTKLPDNIINNNKFVTLILEATLKDYRPAQSVVSLELPDLDPTDILKFEKPHYNGVYFFANSSLSLEVISLSEGYDGSETFQLDEENGKYFEVKSSGHSVTITIAQGGLPEDILEDTRLITLTLEATRVSAVTAVTVINIQLIPQTDIVHKVLSFTSHHYSGSYSKDHVITIDTDIMLKEDDIDIDQVTVEVIGDELVKEYFSVKWDGEKFEVQTTKLPDNIINNNKFVTLILEATLKDYRSAQSVVSLELPDLDPTDILKFEKPHYNGVYFFANSSLSLEVISLSEGYDGSETFQLDEENGKYFEVKSSGHSVTITIAQGGLPEDILEDTRLITLTLEATRVSAVTAVTVINIQLIPQTDIVHKVLSFTSHHYSGSYSKDHVITIDTDIMLKEDDIDIDQVTVEVIGDELVKEYFSVKWDGEKFEVQTTKLPDNIINNNKFVTLILEATLKDYRSAQSVVSLELPDLDPTDILKFEKPHYNGVYFFANSSLSLEVISLSEGYDGSETFQLDEENGKYFEVKSSGHSVTITIAQGGLPEDILEDTRLITLTLEATRVSAVTAVTVINIQLIPQTDIVHRVLSFTSHHYSGSYSKDHVITIDTDIMLKEDDIDIDQVTVEVIGDELVKEYFSVKWNGEKFEVQTTKLPDNIINNNKFVTLILEATLKDYRSAQSVVSLELPDLDPTDILKFEKPHYNGVYFFANSSLSLEVISLSEGYDGSETFQLDEENGKYFEVKSSGHSVTITIAQGGLPEDILEDTRLITLTLEATRVSAVTAVTVINIRLIPQTDHLLDALIIKSVRENHAYNSIYTQVGCQLEKMDTEPKIPDSWFYISDDKQHLSMISDTDREHELIAFMHKSQVQIKLSVKCSNSNVQTQYPQIESNTLVTDSWNWIYTKPIAFKSNEQIISILVEDENDNSPVFTHTSPLIIGYPVADLAYGLLPQYLTKVEATDADIDLNAKIKYTTDSDKFAIHPETGVIYPKINVFTQNLDEIEFTITATDQDGNGLSNSSKIQVHPIRENNVVVLQIKNGMLENIEKILQEISTKSKLEIKQITSTVLTSPQATSEDSKEIIDNDARLFKRDVSNENVVLSIFVYAMNSENVLVESSHIKEKLNEIDEDVWNVEGVLLSESQFIKEQTHQGNNTGLIVGVSVLGTLLFLVIGGIILAYFLYFRKYYTKFNDDESYTDSSTSSRSSNSSRHDSLAVGNRKDQYSISEKTSNHTDIINPRYSGTEPPYVQNTFMVNTSPHQANAEDDFGENVGNKRKKSNVKFNENVLQIEVDDYQSERL